MVKVLLESQERALRSSLDVIVEQMNARIKAAEGTTSEVIKSLEFSQADIRDLRNEVTVLRKSDYEKQAEIEALKKKVAELERRMNYQEDYSRRYNLRITGFLEQGETTWEQTSIKVSSLIENKLQLPSIKLERSHRVGVSTSSHSRPVVVRFMNFGDREAVLRNARKLKGTGIFINEDLCPASLEERKKQFPLLKKAREEGKVAFFRHTRLIIREKTTQDSSSSVPIAGSLRGVRDSRIRSREAECGSGTSLEAPGGAHDSPLVTVGGGGGACGGASLEKASDATRDGPPVTSGDGGPVTLPLETAKKRTTEVGDKVETPESIATRTQKAPRKKK